MACTEAFTPELQIISIILIIVSYLSVEHICRTFLTRPVSDMTSTLIRGTEPHPTPPFTSNLTSVRLPSNTEKGKLATTAQSSSDSWRYTYREIGYIAKDISIVMRAICLSYAYTINNYYNVIKEYGMQCEAVLQADRHYFDVNISSIIKGVNFRYSQCAYVI